MKSTETKSSHLAFLSYRTRRAAEVAPLIDALTQEGINVWRDDARIDEGTSITDGVVQGIADSRVMLCWYSLDYPESRICQWEQAVAWVAAEAIGEPLDRVLLLLPPDVPDPNHVLGLMKDEKAWRVPAGRAELRTFARRIADHVRKLADPRPLGALASLGQTPTWYLRRAAIPSDRFTGRAKDLWNLHSFLHADRMLVITGRGGQGSAQVRGMGGIGKTLLAVEYATRFGAAFPGGILWIDAGGRSAGSLLHDLAPPFRIPAGPDAPGHVLAALEARGSYLWMVDNLPAGLTWIEAEAWCAPTKNGRTLITTRNRAWEGMGKALDLDVMEPVEALALLSTRRPPEGEAEAQAAVQLCHDVGYHPLTLDVLGALIANNPTSAPYADWRTRLQEPDKDALRLVERLKEELPTQTARYVGTVLQTSLQGLEVEALDLLLLAVSMAEAPIPAAFAVDVIRKADDLPDREAQDRVALGLDAACNRCLLDTVPVAGAKSALVFTVHALVRRCLAYEPEHGDRIRALRENAARKARVAMDSVLDIRRHGDFASIVPHAEHLAGRVETLDEARLAFQLAHFQQVRGIFREAVPWWNRVLEARTRLLGPEHPGTLGTLLNLAMTLYDQRDLPGARKLEEQVLTARTRLLGPGHPDTLKTLQNLAATLQAQGDLAGARKLFEQALEARTRLLGPEHPDNLNTLQNLAVTLKAQGDLSGARKLEEQALEAQTRLLGPEHPDTLTTLQNLAGTLDAQGDVPGARKLYEQALKARTRLLGHEHPDTTMTRFNLVLILLQVEPNAAGPHIAELRCLRDRPRESLSAVERRILEKLPGVEFRLLTSALPFAKIVGLVLALVLLAAWLHIWWTK